MAASSSSSPFFGIREEDHQKYYIKPHQMSSTDPPAPSSTAVPPPPNAPPPKRKRNLPGTPNPDAEVIALSPKTLMATNRFICEVCGKGFQREQNLQLHRRGHNLPWKLRQKSTKEVKRRVYLCPEPSCVHHDPSRALGDLTGIKKHFCRKHGEKKWKCDKCSKRYAVQSDWKAHSKTCGTREYRCDCGTLFSRRDSFITHRAFCDALSQESARLPTGVAYVGSQHNLYANNSMGLAIPPQVTTQIPSLHTQNHPSADNLRFGGGGGGGGTAGRQLNDLMLSVASNPPSYHQCKSGPSSSSFFLGGSNQEYNMFHEEGKHSRHPMLHNDGNNKPPFHGLTQLPADMQGNRGDHHSNIFNLSFLSGGRGTSSMSNGSNNIADDHNANSTLIPVDQFNTGKAKATDQQAAIFAGSLMGNTNLGSCAISSIYSSSIQTSESLLPQMSATALLQKAAQMGATTSTTTGPSLLRALGGPSSSSHTGGGARSASFRGHIACNVGEGGMRSQMAENENNFQDLMNSLANGQEATALFGDGNNSSTGVSPVFDAGGHGRGSAAFEGFNTSFGTMDEAKFHQNMLSMGGSHGLTRDFLGVGGVVRRGGLSDREQQHHGLDSIGDFDSEMKNAGNSRPFLHGSLQ